MHPLVAFLLGHFALGMSGAALFAVVVAAALPTAQNVYVTSQRYQVGVAVAKDTVLLTTSARHTRHVCRGIPSGLSYTRRNLKAQ